MVYYYCQRERGGKAHSKNSSKNFKKPIDNIKIKCYNINVKRLRNKGFDRTATTKKIKKFKKPLDNW